MKRRRIEVWVPPGGDEPLVYQRVADEAKRHGCTASSTRGAPWPVSMGRKLVFMIDGPDTLVGEWFARRYLGLDDDAA